MTEEWSKLHNEELNDLYSSYIILVIKSRRMREAGHVVRTAERSGAYRVLVGKLEGKRALRKSRRRGQDNRDWDVSAWSGFIWLRIRTVGGNM